MSPERWATVARRARHLVGRPVRALFVFAVAAGIGLALVLPFASWIPLPSGCVEPSPKGFGFPRRGRARPGLSPIAGRLGVAGRPRWSGHRDKSVRAVHHYTLEGDTA